MTAPTPVPVLRAAEDVILRPGLDSAYVVEHTKPSHRVWFALVGDDVVGALRVDVTTGATGAEVIGDNVVIDTLIVESTYRRRGYGRWMLNAVESWLSDQRDLPRTLSLAVETANAAAVALYDSVGYVQLADASGDPVLIGDGDGAGCLVMFKRLD